MTKARVFKSGNSQAVLLRKEFRFKSDQVEIFRLGNDVVLREEYTRLRARGKGNLTAWSG